MRLSSNCGPLSQSAPGVLFSRERTPLPWGAARAESGRQRRAIAGGIAGFCRSVTPRLRELLRVGCTATFDPSSAQQMA